jgi:hypothetical protein
LITANFLIFMFLVFPQVKAHSPHSAAAALFMRRASCFHAKTHSRKARFIKTPAPHPEED